MTSIPVPITDSVSKVIQMLATNTGPTVAHSSTTNSSKTIQVHKRMTGENCSTLKLLFIPALPTCSGERPRGPEDGPHSREARAEGEDKNGNRYSHGWEQIGDLCQQGCQRGGEINHSGSSRVIGVVDRNVAPTV